MKGTGAKRLVNLIPASECGLCKADAIVVALALALGLASALALPFLTYDSWAWMIWARELTSLSMDASAGPSMKPLPVLFAAPLARFGDLGPLAWLTIARASFLVCPWAALRLGTILADRLAGVIAAAGLLMMSPLQQTAIEGYSEPLVVLLVLLAVTALVRNRAETALVCLVFAGLMRPEVWLYIWAVALWLLLRKKIGLVRALSYSLVAPTIWLSMVWMSTGTPSHVVNQAASQPPSKLLAPTWQLIDQIPLPALVFAGVTLACFFAYIQRNRTLTVLLAAAVSAVALYQIMVTLGMASQPRYLMPGAALLIICSAWGFSRAVDALPNRRAQELITLAVVCGLVISVPAIVHFKVLRQVSTTSMIASPGRQVAALDALSEAVGLAGGKSAVLAKGRPIMVNISMRSGMAWKLGVPLGEIAPVWPDTKASGVKGPAFAFEAPASDAGVSFGLPLRVSSTTVGKSGPWRVLLIDPPGRPSPQVSR